MVRPWSARPQAQVRPWHGVLLAGCQRRQSVLWAHVIRASAVTVVVLWFGAEGEADGRDHSGGCEVAQVCSAPRELPNRAVATVRNVEIALLVEGQSSGLAQPCAREVAQVLSTRGELPNRVVTSIRDIEIASLVERDATRHVEPGGGKVAEVHTGWGKLANPADVSHVQVAVPVEG